MEHVLTSQLIIFLKRTNISNQHQHGFHSSRGWQTQLTELIADRSNTLDKEEETESCVLHFAEVFDKNNHYKLTKRLPNGLQFQVHL